MGTWGTNRPSRESVCPYSLVSRFRGKDYPYLSSLPSLMSLLEQATGSRLLLTHLRKFQDSIDVVVAVVVVMDGLALLRV